jgi:hypothetical protein
VASWRDELIEAAKTKAERDEEEQSRHRKRVQEALHTAEAAFGLAVEAIKFARDRLADKGQAPQFSEQPDAYTLELLAHKIHLELVRDSAVIKVVFGEGKPRDFDFAKDRHIAPADVEEYVGRRTVELVKNAQKASPW